MSWALLMAALAVAGVVWLLVPRGPTLLGRAAGSSWKRQLPLLVAPAVVLTLLVGPRAVALVGVAGIAGLGTLDLARRERSRRVAAKLRKSVVEVGEALAGEVRAGRPPADALSRVAEQYRFLREAAQTAGLDGDVPSALRSVAATPGAESLLPMAASWQLSMTAGAALAEALDRASAQARADMGVAAVVDGELSSARATARLLAVLPFLILAVGRGLGFDPWGFLLRSWPGLACLAVGVVLSLVGLRWLDQIGDQVARS